MFVGSGGVAAGSVVEADVCVVGGGAAGITLARDLGAAGRRVVLLESGGFDETAAANDLNAGRSAGRPYLDLTTCRLRYLGGTTNHWGGWCLPLDPIDMERGWPFGRAVLDPWYRRAQEVLQLGAFEYRPGSWGIRDVPGPFGGPHFEVRMLQNSPPTRFREVYGPELRRSERVSVHLDATVVGVDAEAGAVRGVRVAGLGGARYVVRAGAYVLACGGIENARVLLAAGLGGDQVGRHFMVHLECTEGAVAVADPYTDFGFYTNVTSNGRPYAPLRGRFSTFIGLSEATMRARGLPAVKVMWGFGYGPGIGTVRALQGAMSWAGTGHRWADLGGVASDPVGAARYVARRMVGAQALPVSALTPFWTFEPTPYAPSRVRLGGEVDALGQRRVEVDWRLDPGDRARAAAVVRLFGAEVGRAGFGRVRSALADEDADWPAEMFGDQHHMGTTRMDADPARGVVDADCRVHGVGNLFVAGSSVFPRAGAANPTLTIVALALRLGQHLRGRG